MKNKVLIYGPKAVSYQFELNFINELEFRTKFVRKAAELIAKELISNGAIQVLDSERSLMSNSEQFCVKLNCFVADYSSLNKIRLPD